MMQLVRRANTPFTGDRNAAAARLRAYCELAIQKRLSAEKLNVLAYTIAAHTGSAVGEFSGAQELEDDLREERRGGAKPI